MLTAIKIIFFALITFLGVKEMNKDFLIDLYESPFRYFAGLTTGLFTFFNIPVTIVDNIFVENFIKMGFAIVTASVSTIVIFATKRLLSKFDKKNKNEDQGDNS
jgi:hypothetical protein